MPLINGVRVTDRQQQVYTALKDYGPLPDHALVPLAQHVVKLPQSSSGIRTRRKELSDLGLAAAVSTTTTRSGRQAAIHEAV